MYIKQATKLYVYNGFKLDHVLVFLQGTILIMKLNPLVVYIPVFYYNSVIYKSLSTEQ